MSITTASQPMNNLKNMAWKNTLSLLTKNKNQFIDKYPCTNSCLHITFVNSDEQYFDNSTIENPYLTKIMVACYLKKTKIKYIKLFNMLK